MTDKLASKVALVTGGSSGIGLGIAKRFAHEGVAVVQTAMLADLPFFSTRNAQTSSGQWPVWGMKSGSRRQG